jgi:hypothetical protein
MPGKSSIGRGRTSKARGRNILPSDELAQNEMSWGGEGEGRRGSRSVRSGLGLSARKTTPKRGRLARTALAIGVAKARRGAIEGKAETPLGKKVRRLAKGRRLARKGQQMAALRRGKARLPVVKKLARAKGRQAVRKAKRTRRSRAS